LKHFKSNRHFPTRADVIVAVFRHQVEACAEAGPALLASADSDRSDRVGSLTSGTAIVSLSAPPSYLVRYGK
jgi:hypothetical protein